MAEFLTTSGVSHRLEGIINDAEQRLYLISPYLQTNARIREIIARRAQSKSIDIRVICRNEDLRPDEKTWLASVPSIRIMGRDNLHAKCYMNEKEALLTSMNLYEYSQRHNDEMGILVSKESDGELYDKIYGDVRRILDWSRDLDATASKVETAEKSGEDAKANPANPQRGASAATARNRRKAKPVIQAPETGCCIRCKKELPADPTKPYCWTCYTKRNQFINQGRHCHICGKEHPTTLEMPLCRPCYRKYKDVLELAAS